MIPSVRLQLGTHSRISFSQVPIRIDSIRSLTIGTGKVGLVLDVQLHLWAPKVSHSAPICTPLSPLRSSQQDQHLLPSMLHLRPNRTMPNLGRKLSCPREFGAGAHQALSATKRVLSQMNCNFDTGTSMPCHRRVLHLSCETSHVRSQRMARLASITSP
jgi:hypothetical protein